MEIEAHEGTSKMYKKLFTEMFMNIELLKHLNIIKTKLVSGI